MTNAATAVIAVDIGSSGVRAVAFDDRLVVVTSAERSLRTQADATGRSAHSWPELLSLTLACVVEVSAQLDAVAAVVLSGTASCVVATNSSRTRTSDVVLWSDRRAEPHSSAVLAEQERAFERTLCPPHLSYWPAKLVWLQQERHGMSGSGEGLPTYAGAKDLVFENLTGQLWTDPMSAAATGVFDSAAWGWDQTLLERCGVSTHQLPEVHDSVDRLPLTAEAAALTGLPPGTPVVVGGMDGPLSQVGAGGFNINAASCTVGTSIAYRTGLLRRTLDPQRRAWCYPVTRDFWVLGGAGSNGGNVLSYVAGLLGRGVEEALHEALSVPPDAGLLFLPYLYGERSPLWRDDLRAAVVGLSPHHDQAAVARAALDGVAAALVELSEAVTSLAGRPERVYLTGGFLRSGDWAQLMTDAIGVDTCVPEPKDATACGGATLAWLSLGVSRLPVPARPSTDLRSPDASAHLSLSARVAATARVRAVLYPEIVPHPDNQRTAEPEVLPNVHLPKSPTASATTRM
jgi:gluconokinase